MFAVFVTINIKDGFADEFQKASFGDSQGSVKDEPGCFRFDFVKFRPCDPQGRNLKELTET